MPPILLIFFSSLVPIVERGAIPLGLSMGLSWPIVFLVVSAGNAVVIMALLLFLKYGSAWAAAHISFIRRALDKVFVHTRDKHQAKLETLGFGALIVFVAIPSPATGVWTASVAAYLIAMPIQKAFFAILIGGLIANAMLLTATLGVIKFL